MNTTHATHLIKCNQFVHQYTRMIKIYQSGYASTELEFLVTLHKQNCHIEKKIRIGVILRKLSQNPEKRPEQSIH